MKIEKGNNKDDLLEYRVEVLDMEFNNLICIACIMWGCPGIV